MSKQQIERIAEEVKLILDLPHNKLPVVNIYVKRAVNHALVFCNRDDIPERMEPVIAQMAEDMLRADNVVDTPKGVASIERGDTTIKYSDAQSAYSLSSEFFKNYERQLVHFKKMKLPKGDLE